MTEELDVEQVAGALLVSIRLLVRQVRQMKVSGELTIPESSALARLDRGGPATSSELARQEQIRPQSMGATLAGLQERGLLRRSPDPNDGRRIVLSITEAGRAELRNRRDARTELLAAALRGFTRGELKQLMAAAPLIERLAQQI
jgi:DNA-binding MarR family transcriptional regulator